MQLARIQVNIDFNNIDTVWKREKMKKKQQIQFEWNNLRIDEYARNFLSLIECNLTSIFISDLANNMFVFANVHFPHAMDKMAYTSIGSESHA